MALTALVLACANSFAVLRLARGGGTALTPDHISYAGPDRGEKWPLARGPGRETFVAVSKRCPPCVVLISSLAVDYWDKPLTMLVLGPPLDQEVSSRWFLQSLSHDEAKARLGIAATPYAVVTQDGIVAAHGIVNSATDLQSLEGR